MICALLMCCTVQGDPGNLKRSAINNSLLDLADSHSVLGYPGLEKHGVGARRGSVGSLGRTSPLINKHKSRITRLKDPTYFRGRYKSRTPNIFCSDCLIADSGMSVSFQSGSAGSAGTVSQESSPQQQLSNIHASQLHNLNRTRKLSNGNQSTNL